MTTGTVGDRGFSWTLLTGHVLVEIARNPEARIRDISAAAGITERTAQAIVSDLEVTDSRVSIPRGIALPATNGADAGEEHEMSKIGDVSKPASELERLIADLSESGPLIFVFGISWWTAHLTGTTAPVFRGPADRRWWHVQLGDGGASWTMDVRVDEITGVRFGREPYPFPSFPGREGLTVQFLGPGGDTVLSCYVHELYNGQRMRPEKLAAWRALRERYGNRDQSRADRGALLTPAA